MADRDVVDLAELDRAQIALAGGKGANLGELTRIDGVRVPSGFCVTTDAFRRIVAGTARVDELVDRLSLVASDDQDHLRTLSSDIRGAIEALPIPDDLATAISDALGRHGEHAAYAVRSSATAEDLPTASFAGQHDSYLDVVGPDAIVDDIRRCWASLFTERAVAYRLRNGIDHRTVAMAVVVQRMVEARAAGVLFTADPVSGNRTVTTVEAVAGLGEALVSGQSTPDRYEVRGDTVVARTVASDQPVLTDSQVLELVELGRRIEVHFDSPQDIEWCLDDEGFHVVQSRPITTLFPIPDIDDDTNHVYVSVGHQQMMTDPMTPLGLSVWKLTSPAPMRDAGGRLFVDVTAQLAAPASRAAVLDALGRSDPLIRDALETVIDRGFVPSHPDATPPAPAPGGATDLIDADPALVTELIGQTEAMVAEVAREIESKHGSELFDVIRADLQERRALLFDPRNLQVIMTAIEATWWLNEQMEAWLGERNAADTLAQSVPHNITSEMGLALLDVADVIRPHPGVVAFLRTVDDGDDRFLDELTALDGGDAARAAIVDYLGRYGMRCIGEIDITRPRWSERPSALVPMLLSNIDNFAAGEAERRFERGRQEALAKEQDLLERLRALPDGARKADQTKRMIDRLRTFIGYREHPKYGMISRYFLYKQAMLAEAERLVQNGVLRAVDDIYFLTFDELQEVVRTNEVDDALVGRRREAFRSYGSLTPPRVLTSDGEALNGAYRRNDVPAGALVGLAVSAGTVEGRARVIVDVGEADLEPGDILVTRFTDPSWSPLFVAAAGLVTEVGGVMTHGAVIAREYGLPAVVGVECATTVITDGQRIRVHGADGYVEILPST